MAKGKCRFCGKYYEKGGIVRHLRSCSVCKNFGNDGEKALYSHCTVSDRYERKTYWLNLLLHPKTDLEDLDQFLRAIWVECCGHGSSFFVKDSLSSLVGGPGKRDLSMDLTVAKASSISDTLHYIYDFGSSTELTLTFFKPLEFSSRERSIVIAARNVPLHFQCSCGNSAKYLCARCESIGNFSSAYVCEECGVTHPCGEEYLYAICNSPRMGVCGYNGSDFDPEGEEIVKESPVIQPLGREADFQGGMPIFQSPDLELITGEDELYDPYNGIFGKEPDIKKVYEAFEKIPPDEKSFLAARASMERLDECLGPYYGAFRSYTDVYLEDGEPPITPIPVFLLFLLSLDPPDDMFPVVEKVLKKDAGAYKGFFSRSLNDGNRLKRLLASLGRKKPEGLSTLMLNREHETLVRISAAAALVTVYLYGLIKREEIIAYLKSGLETAKEEENLELADHLVSICLNIYPEDFIKHIYALKNRGLLRDGEKVSDHILKITSERNGQERQLYRVRESGFYSYIMDPEKELREIFKDKFVLDSFKEPSKSIPFTRKKSKVARNEPCPCGSGKKYKRCCGR